MTGQKEKLLGMTLEELQAAAVSCGLKSFVGKQLAEWMYKKRVGSWEGMTNISKAAKEKLAARFDLGTSLPAGRAESTDGTVKYLFEVSPCRSGRAGSCASQDGISQNTKPDGVAQLRAAGLGNVTPNVQLTGSAEMQAGGIAGQGSISQNVQLTGSAMYPDTTPAEAVEAVMIPDADRRTLCVSSQAGCKMGCKFCMTGRQGFHGNLDTADILNQFISIDEPESLTNTVFMGMGEPLDNYAAVEKAITVLTAEWGFAWSPKRITVSTIGVIPTLKRYLDGQRCHLAVSIHNPFPEERLEMMPVQKAYDIRDILKLIRQYDFTGQRRVSFEYTMFAGFNDDKRHADALTRLLRGLECRVNLIRFHKIPDFPYDCASDVAMQAFRDRLNNNGITCTIRSSRGEDILAACGMLAGQHSRQQ